MYTSDIVKKILVAELQEWGCWHVILDGTKQRTDGLIQEDYLGIRNLDETKKCINITSIVGNIILDRVIAGTANIWYEVLDPATGTTVRSQMDVFKKINYLPTNYELKY